VSTWSIAGDLSSVEIHGKSSLHPIHGRLRAGSMTGTVQATMTDSGVDLADPVVGHVEFALTDLSFGNAMYDRELPKRLDTGRYPTVTLDLVKIQAAEPDTYQVALQLALHGTTVAFNEAVQTTVDDEGQQLTVRGEHRFDIRDFGVEPPRMLGMKVHPDFTVHLTIVARRDP